jgi:glycosyltransferase involved in cell wall biosynthesis
MRVLHLSSEKSWRGGEQQIAYLVLEQRAQGIDVEVAVRKGSSFEAFCQKNNFSYTSLSFASSISIGTALAIKSICRVKKIDLVHMHAAKSHSIGVLSAFLGNRTPLILSRRVDFVPKNSFFTRWKYNHRAIKKILCVSDKIREIMQAYVNHPGIVATVHSGIDLAKFSAPTTENILRQEFNIDPSTVLIGNTSALEKHKDYHTFIDAIEHVLKRGHRVAAFIIGKGSLEIPLKKYVEEKGIRSSFHFTGFRNDITRVLPCLDIFMITSNEEGLGTSVLDAFAARVPVVATHAGGIPEMVVDEQSGLLAPIGDPKTLADNLERLIKTPSLRTTLIEGAQKKLTEFSKEATAEKTIRAYQEVLAQR